MKRGEGSRSGKPAVIVGVQKQPGANTIELTQRLDHELDTLQHELPRGMTIDRKIFRQADFIEVAVDNVVSAFSDGGILVIVIVLLKRLRRALAAPPSDGSSTEGTAFDLVVKFDPESSADFERIADLPIDTPAGHPVPVRLLADVQREEGANMILRENVQGRIVRLLAHLSQRT